MATSVAAASSVQMNRPSDFHASRYEMLQQGVPEDFVEALLNDSYMERLIDATNCLNAKRQRKLQRYHKMNMVIFIFLLLQALVGICTALYKTVLMPTFIFSSKGNLESVDLVLMLDASIRMADLLDVQRQAAQNFTGMLHSAMHQHREKTQQKVREKIESLQRESESGIRRIFPFLNYLMPVQKKDQVKLTGGYLRVSTGLFNSKEGKTRLLHDFTRDLGVQQEALSAVSRDSYADEARWLDALKLCNGAVEGALRPSAKRFCAIIGDNEAMCKKQKSTAVDDTCRKWPHLCPDEDELDTTGVLLEYSHEIQDCNDYVDTNLTVSGLSLIMMFTVKTENERQARLRSRNFRNFVQTTTDCTIHQSSSIVTLPNNETKTVESWAPESSCLRFIMGTDLEQIMEKAERIAELLKDKTEEVRDPNKQQDYRYLFFLLLPLNLVFFVIGSQLIRLWTRVHAETQRMRGMKKKMIKVTKTLVEKERRDSTVQRFAQQLTQLTEVEMAEVVALRPLVEFGAPMTMRARLRGGYLRTNVEQDTADGNGHAFDPNSNWSFEPVHEEDSSLGALRQNQQVHIRDSKGHLLRVDASGTGFVPDAEGSAEAAGAATVFTVEPLEAGDDESAMCHLGDTVRVRSCATGQFVRVHKDGICDGLGGAAETETQLVIDRGGQHVGSGNIVTMRPTFGTQWLHGTPEGIVQALPGGQDWRYWLIERSAGAKTGGSGKAADGDSSGGADAASSTTAALLRQGDVVTLRGFNQQYLEVDPAGRCYCSRDLALGQVGGGLGTLQEEGATAEADAGPGAGKVVGEFVIERVGMGMVSKHDNSIRRGAQISLKPVSAPAAGSGDTASCYLRVNADGSLTADGRVTGREISITLDVAAMHDVVQPLAGALQQGDVDLLIAPLWNKADVKHLDALSSAWTQDADLEHFQGAVVVASDQGTYTVPKAMGDGFQGWVAVVNEGVDLKKAAKQAKAQGATGVIVRCANVLSLERLAHSCNDADPPELPAVFVDKAVGEALDERGLTLKGSEFKRKYMTEVMRSIGRAGVSSDIACIGDVFRSTGNAMLERLKEKRNNPEAPEVEVVAVEAEDDSQSGYKWKVSSNTHYLWSRSGGGATKMNVDYGKAAPPAALKKTKVDATTGRELRTSVDASADKWAKPESMYRSSLKAVTMVLAEDVKCLRLATQLSEVLTTQQAAEPLEQLSDESDFKIEYAFEEVEIGVGENPEDLEEEALMDDGGAVIATLAVPMAKFWIVAMGLVISTCVLCGTLFYLLRMPLADEDVGSGDDDDLYGSAGAAFSRVVAPALQAGLSVAPGLRLRDSASFLRQGPK